MIRNIINKSIREKGIKQTWIANKTGMSTAFLSLYLNGRKTVSTLNINALLNVLGLKIYVNDKPIEDIREAIKTAVQHPTDANLLLSESTELLFQNLDISRVHFVSFLSGERKLAYEKIEKCIHLLKIEIK